jgi:hypothetical protein
MIFINLQQLSKLLNMKSVELLISKYLTLKDQVSLNSKVQLNKLRMTKVQTSITLKQWTTSAIYL